MQRALLRCARRWEKERSAHVNCEVGDHLPLSPLQPQLPTGLEDRIRPLPWSPGQGLLLESCYVVFWPSTRQLLMDQNNSPPLPDVLLVQNHSDFFLETNASKEK